MDDMETEKIRYDIAIIGSGIGGSTLAAVLARQRLKVIVFEAGVHPKFAIGESMILETSEIMRALAEFYDVPELAYYSSENYVNFIGTQHGVKRHFSFLYHTPGQPFPGPELLAGPALYRVADRHASGLPRLAQPGAQCDERHRPGDVDRHR